MGAALNWLAVQTTEKATTLSDLGLLESGAVANEFEALIACAEFPDGWLVIVSPGMELKLDRLLPLASQGGLALGCEVEERVMFSELRAFRGGAPAWRVTHDPDVDLTHLAVEGEPPAPFAEVRASLEAEAAADGGGEVDYMFDVAVRLGRAISGYSHDEPSDVVWTALDPAPRRTAGKSLWRRIVDRVRDGV